MMNYDIAIFQALNGWAGRAVALDAVFIFGARWLLPFMAALVLVYVFAAWKTNRFQDRLGDSLHAAAAVTVAFVLEKSIGFLWFRARPFAALSGVVQLIEKSPLEKSFPSGHASAAFALAFGIWLHQKRWGWILLVLAAGVGLSRIFVGVHYPSDVLAGALLGYVCARLTAPVKRRVEPYLDLVPFFRKQKQRDV